MNVVTISFVLISHFSFLISHFYMVRLINIFKKKELARVPHFDFFLFQNTMLNSARNEFVCGIVDAHEIMSVVIGG